jgi:hypothetical protein
MAYVRGTKEWLTFNHVNGCIGIFLVTTTPVDTWGVRFHLEHKVAGLAFVTLFGGIKPSHWA